MGFTYDEMNLLGCLSINDLITLSQAPLPLVDITIRHDVLQKLLASSHEENRRQEQLNRAVRLGLNHTDEPVISGLAPEKPVHAAGYSVSPFQTGEHPFRMKKPMLQSGISGKKYRVENIDSRRRWTP